MIRLSIKILIAALLILQAGCRKKAETDSSRSFYLGTTPWPGDFTLPEVDLAYQFINDHCDIVSHHFDDGIPYEEFYQQLVLPSSFVQDILTRKTKTAVSKKVFLSVSALNLSRKQKADYYKETSYSQSIKEAWKNLAFNDPKMVAAYTNYISYLIDQFNPLYVNYGVESNLWSWPAADFIAYKDFLSKVYAQLKTRFPGIPFFVSFMVDESAEGLKNASDLMAYSDWVALSAYPYTSVSSSADGNTDPSRFPDNYFERYIRLDAAKPFAFVETAYIAEDLVIPVFSLNKKGNEDWQQAYLEKTLQLSEKYKAKLYIWFCSKDYDAGNNTLRTMGLYQDLFGFWEDTGLINEKNQPRKAHQTWLQWMAKERR